MNDFEEVEISSVLGEQSAGRYFHIEIAHQGAAVDGLRSMIERSAQPDCADCLSNGIAAIHGFAINSATWSGADVFVPRGLPGVVVVSEAFREIVEAHEFSNVELVPTEEFMWDPEVRV